MPDNKMKIKAVLAWAYDGPGDRKNFDPTFVESLDEFLANRGHLTDGQEDALDSIIEKFDIDVAEWS